MKKNSVTAFLIGMAMCLSLAAYEPQFSIPDATIDQNFRNAAAENRAISLDLATAAQLSSTQTFSGENTFSGTTSTTTFSGWIDIGLVSISSVSVPSSTMVTATCAAGYKTLGCGGKCNNGATAALYVDFSGESSCQTKCTAATNNSSVARCARIK